MTLLKSVFSSFCVLFFVGLVLTSCEKENDVTLNAQAENSTESASNFTGSSDDSSDTDTHSDSTMMDCECFEFVYPITVVLPDGTNVPTNTDEELENAIEDWFIAQGENAEMPTFAYPITITLTDNTEQVIQNDEELMQAFDACFEEGDFYDDEYGDYGDYGDYDDEGDYEDDYEEDELDCFTVNYPITVTLDSTQVTVNSDEELFDIFDSLYDSADMDSDTDMTDMDMDLEEDILVYPITVTLIADGTEVTVNNDQELEALCAQN